ncbi:hypothetical protein J7I97_12050 [Streptomyces sp. ISL-87]|nr:hypothetical protein [Streptomyces sp. ISL-21]MBT2453792.1 hypothetical protein [Streptomyces sp. ISL-86]MBT2608993.1 hypothetical protein [Streptomyces sp. ISL-87]
MEQVRWEAVHKFVIGSVERPLTAKRKRVVMGLTAVRVPKGGKDRRVLAPCAYPGSGLTLYEDPGARRLLCSVDAPEEVDGERRHVVRDAGGEPIGTIRRIAPRRPFKHTWRIDQPGHPEIVGRNEWAGGQGVLKAAMALADSAMGMGIEGGDQRSKPRTLEWRAGDRTVMVSGGGEEVTIRASWLDRRLAFAFALLGDR